MLEVRHSQGEAKTPAQPQQDVEQGQGVRPAGAGHEHVHAVVQESLRPGVA